MDGDFNLGGESGQRFVDRIVDHFIHEMVQTQIASRSDIHRGTFAHRFHPAEHFDGVGVIVVLSAAVISGNRCQASVFRFSFYDGGIDLFCGHSAPWSTPDLSGKIATSESSD